MLGIALVLGVRIWAGELTPHPSPTIPRPHLMEIHEPRRAEWHVRLASAVRYPKLSERTYPAPCWLVRMRIPVLISPECASFHPAGCLRPIDRLLVGAADWRSRFDNLCLSIGYPLPESHRLPMVSRRMVQPGSVLSDRQRRCRATKESLDGIGDAELNKGIDALFG